ncbi:serine/threonine protein kinase US3 [Equid alphaherpesvirus 3]|uniref:non-specific serine/threonine protein kinase n=1 Tax=Equid alphaherpesvirus 3 TaxID=80341 RepID=A0A077B9F9_9ALPH|nr:serine/threonine protein kinase US3 [Equid alphaherpesvirus 3]AIL02987.1 serine/threonine protein kinase US3 [Equid alphaherpesvirus 3]
METRHRDRIAFGCCAGSSDDRSEVYAPMDTSVAPDAPPARGGPGRGAENVAMDDADLYSDISDGELDYSDDDRASNCGDDEDDDLVPSRSKAVEVAASFRYKIVKTLTPGSEGRVFVAQKEGEDETVVLKIGQKGTNLIEAMMLKNVEHRAVIKLLDTLAAGDITCMVLPHYRSDLYTFLTQRARAIPLDRALMVQRQILEGLSYLHGRKIVHRDIKTENIFLHDFDRVCIADFGAARYPVDAPAELGIAGTVETTAPEVLARAKYNCKADVWSAGVVLFEMLAYPETLFDDVSVEGGDARSCKRQLIKMIATLKIHPDEFPPDRESKLFRNYIDYATRERRPRTRYVCMQQHSLPLDGEFLIHKMMTFDADERPSAAELLAYPMLSNNRPCA